MQKLLPTRAFMFFSVIFLLLLLSLSFMAFWRQTNIYKNKIIAEHIGVLSEIFKKINEQCGIINFGYQQNYIDFLNVESFVGSQIGSMNLKYPQHWQGPYLKENPTMQEKYYEIIYTYKGYFIVPGQGVQLTDGKIIGKDIIFSKDTDIEALIKSEVLRDKEKNLAVKLF